MTRLALRKGFYWGSASKLVNTVLGLATTVVLARYLSPEDFGIAAVAVVVFQAIMLFRDAGVSTAIITEQNRSQALVNTGATVFIILGIVLFGLCLITAPLTASFLDDARLTDPIRFIALALLFTSFCIIHSTLAQKEMHFKYRFEPDIYGRVVLATLTLVGAVMGFGYWSIIGGIVASSFVRMILYHVTYPISYTLHIDRACLQRMYSFSSFVLLNAVLNFILNHADQLIVGKLISLEEMGYYHIAHRIAVLQSELFYPVLGTLLLPYYSRLDPVELSRRYLQVTRYLRLLVIPLSFYVMLISEPFLVFVYEGKWLPILPILYIFCLFGITRALSGHESVYLYAKKQAAVITALLLIRTVVSYGFIFIFQSQMTANRIAMVFTGQAFLYFLFWVLYLHVKKDIRAGDMLSGIVKPLGISCGAFLFTRWIVTMLPLVALQEFMLSSFMFLLLVGVCYRVTYRKDLNQIVKLVVSGSGKTP